jgi:arylsulfatase A-like enzyme
MTTNQSVAARALLAALSLLALSACTQRAADAPLPIEPGAWKGRDIILITLDTTRRDRIGCYGRQPSFTPNLDAICARGVRFDRAMAVAPVTLPAHASMMTGQYPPRHGARYNGLRTLPQDANTLAERLHTAGYDTVAFVSSFVLDRRYGLAQGFAHYDDTMLARAAMFDPASSQRQADKTTIAAVDYLDERALDKPLFLWMHYYDPHTPYLTPVAGVNPTEAQRYDGEVAFVDHEIARLLASPALDPDNTVIVVLADHGEGLGDHGERTHGLFVYDSTVAIPWFIAGPGLKPGSARALVSQVDLLPTLLDALGLARTPEIEGRSLLDAPRATGDTVFIETTLPYFDFRLSALHALRSEGSKYIQAPRAEFYRIGMDPTEEHNLLGDTTPAPDAERMASDLENYLAQWPDLESPVAATDGDDADALARLRSLGYLAGNDLGMNLTDPKDALSLVQAHQAATELAAAARYEEALAALDATLAAHPGAHLSLYLRARLLAALSRNQEAEETVRTLNQAHPTADSLLLQAQLAVLDQRLEEAEPLLDAAEQLDPQHGGTHVVRGDIALARGDETAARAAFQHAIDLDNARVGRQARTRLARLDAPKTP